MVNRPPDGVAALVGPPHGVATALALVALAFAITGPPGFMMVERPAGHGFSIVVCTGHGPIFLPTPDQKLSPGKSKAAGICPLAANPTPALTAAFAVDPDHASCELVARVGIGVQAPGRGLTAPLPPATGPPVPI